MTITQKERLTQLLQFRDVLESQGRGLNEKKHKELKFLLNLRSELRDKSLWNTIFN